jgi:hypothetical protein
MRPRALLCLALLFILSAATAAQAPAPPSPEPPPPAADSPPDAGTRHFEVTRAASEVRIDGLLDEPAWSAATVVDLPYEWFPGDNITPPVRTEALVSYDSRFLYVAFRVHDPRPHEIRAHLMDRDTVVSFQQDDYVGFQIDTFNDERRSFQFRVNALGVQFDAVFSEVDRIPDTTWDVIWDSAARITEEGWTAELAIPFQQLRFPRTAGPQTWGFVAFRSYPRNVVHRISSKHTDRRKNCFLCEENKIAGFEGMSAGRNLELAPTATALRTDRQAVPLRGELVEGDEELEPGVSARWGITPNVILNATANPDFSQVEADSAQLDVNLRFALSFPEKRPFFLEGADVLATPIEAVFTRTVVEPEWGVKLSGKEGKNAFGLILAEDERNNLLLPSNQSSRVVPLDMNVRSGVFRYRRDVGERSILGLLYTGREGDDYHGRLLGVDGQLGLTDSDTLRFQALHSETLYPEAIDALGDAFGGEAFLVQYEHQARDWQGSVVYHDLDPSFRADAGFVPRVDVRTAEASARRIVRGKKGGWFTQFDAGLTALRTDDHEGRLTDESFELFGVYQGPLQSTAEFFVTRSRQLFNGVMFELDQQSWGLQASPTGKLRLQLIGRRGDEVDVDNTRRGEILALTPAVQARFGRRLNVNLSHQAQWLDVAGGELFAAHLTQLRLVYQFNVRTALRAVLQRTDISRNRDLYKPEIRPRIEAQSDRLFSQLLFSWKLNPQTVLFLGYSDNRLGTQQVDLTRTERTFFAKVGYAFLF